MKKPEDEKFFKDIVLNDILNEISSENKEILDDTYPRQKKQNSKNKIFGKKIFTIIIGIFLLLLIVLLLNLMTETRPAEHPTSKKYALDKQEWKMEKDRKGYKEELPLKVVKTKVTPKKEVVHKPLIIEPVPIQKTQRELAKEALRQQMLN